MDPVAPLDSILERADRYFMGESGLHHAAVELAKVLDELGLDYAITGAQGAAGDE